MALDSPEMRDLYDIKVFVVSPLQEYCSLSLTSLTEL